MRSRWFSCVLTHSDYSNKFLFQVSIDTSMRVIIWNLGVGTDCCHVSVPSALGSLSQMSDRYTMVLDDSCMPL